MANRQDVEMLQNALQTLGQGAFERNQAQRQAQLEMQRIALEQQMRDVQEKRYDAQSSHYATMEGQNQDRANAALAAQAAATEKANAARITADLKHSDGSTMTFTGTPEQLQAMQNAAKAKGDNITVTGRKDFAATFNVGGANFQFQDQDAADKFAAGMKANHGIDVYSPQAPNVTTTPGGQEIILDAKGHVIKGAPPTPGGTQTIRQVPNPAGGSPLSLTNTTTHLPPSSTGAQVAPKPPQPDPRDIQFIQSDPHPDKIAAFEQKYGQGSSSQFLQSAQPPQPIPGAGGLPIPTQAAPNLNSFNTDSDTP
jgi:hypothetical protein